MGEFRSEAQLSFWPPEPDAHALVRVSDVGDWFLGTCSCGWSSKIKPTRWRVEQQHRNHVRFERQPWDERSQGKH